MVLGVHREQRFSYMCDKVPLLLLPSRAHIDISNNEDIVLSCFPRNHFQELN